jgi:hypothetical protein
VQGTRWRRGAAGMPPLSRRDFPGRQHRLIGRHGLQAKLAPCHSSRSR